MKITIFSCENCGGSRLSDSHDACAYCGSSVSLTEKKEQRSYLGARLQGARFKDEDLRGADFSGARLQGAIFVRCNLQCSVFDGARLQGATLRECDLRGASFDGARQQGIVELGCRTN